MEPQKPADANGPNATNNPPESPVAPPPNVPTGLNGDLPPAAGGSAQPVVPSDPSVSTDAPLQPGNDNPLLAQSPAPSVPGGSKRMMLALLVVLILVAIGAAAYFVL